MKRFYESATLSEGEGGHVLLLDDKVARTPGRRPFALPSRAFGEAVAAEWQGQGETIDPTRLPLTRLANATIDGVAGDAQAVRKDLARYASSDLVTYRAGEPEPLVADQAAAWDPVVAWAREALGARFVLAQGMTFVAQPSEALRRVEERIAAIASPFAIAGLHSMTTLTGSALIALMQAAGALDAGSAWRAAHVDELFQESRWGQDEEAASRRAAREIEFRAAARFVALAADTGLARSPHSAGR